MRRSAACSWPSRPARAPARSTPGTTAPSRSPGLVPLFNMELGEITPGGIGAGMYGMLVIGAILAVFIAGLMVGRTPEYLGKKVEAFEIKMAMLVALVLGASILGFTAIASVLPEGLAGPLNPGPHGFSEILYAFSSQTGNNGSAFAGLTGNTPFYNITGALAMLIGRYGMIVPILALAGSMAAKRRVAPSLGTFPTTGVLWTVLLIGVVIIVGALTFFPALVARARSSSSSSRTPERSPDMSLIALMSVDLGRGTRRFQRFVTLGGAKPAGPSRRGRAASSTPSSSGRPSRTPFRKLDPRLLIKNPVMFVVEITAVLVTLIALANADRPPAAPRAGGLGLPGPDRRSGCGSPSCSRPTPRPSPRPAAAPRPPRCAGRAPRRPPTAAAPTARSRTSARPSCARATSSSSRRARRSPATATSSRASASSTRRRSPASRRRSSRSPGTDIRSSVTGGTTLVSDRLVIRVTADPGETFLDRMIALVEGAKRQRTPNEIALAILLAGLTHRLPDGDGDPPAVRRSTPARRSTRSPWWPCSSASSRRPSAACCRRSASPAWTASRASTCSR